MKKLFEEFKKFISRGNVVDLAVGVMIGAAFKAIVDSVVNDLISPIIGIIFSILGSLIGVYNIVGIVLCVLKFLGIVK